MTFPVEYPIAVRGALKCTVECPVQRLIPATLALLGMSLFLVSTSLAQINGTSATSSGAGHGSSGTSPSVTSLGHSGHVPTNSGVTFSAPHSAHGSNGSNGHRHHHSASGDAYYPYYYPYLYAVPFPYSVDASPSDEATDDDDEYQGGPTVFDRRGSGAASYVPPSYEGPAHVHAKEDASAEPADSKSDAEPSEAEPPEPATMLVFKDGRLLEIENYAIVSQTLYDLTPGHPRKIVLADLDLPATEKQNDDHGVTLQLPPSAQAN